MIISMRMDIILLHRNYTYQEYFNGVLFEEVMGDESLCQYRKDHFKEDGYYLIHVHVPWRIITRSNGGWII